MQTPRHVPEIAHWARGPSKGPYGLEQALGLSLRLPGPMVYGRPIDTRVLRTRGLGTERVLIGLEADLSSRIIITDVGTAREASRPREASLTLC